MGLFALDGCQVSNQAEGVTCRGAMLGELGALSD